MSDISYYIGYFGVDSSTVTGEQRRLSYRPQCTGMEERLVNCTQNYTRCEGDGGGRVVISCWNSSRDSSQPTLPHTLAVQTSIITSMATVPSSVLPRTVPTSTSAVAATVPSSVLSSTVPTSVVAIKAGSLTSFKVPSFTPYTPTNLTTEATSDTGGVLVVVGVAGVVMVSALVLVVVVVVCTVWKNRRGHRRSDGQCLFNYQ